MADRRQYYAIKNSLSAAEKKLINFFELQWMLRHSVPTNEELAQHLEIPYTSVNYYLNRKPVIAALEKRGIPWKQHTREDLTPTQVAAAVTMMNFADVRPNDVKLNQLGINPAQYYAWLNDPQFKDLIDTLSDQNLKNIRPTAIGEFTKLINKGDWQAVKYYLDITGAINNQAPQTEQMLMMFVEVIQKYVKDPKIMAAIAQDLKQVTSNRTLEVTSHPVEIPGELVHDPELEDAKKKLGVL